MIHGLPAETASAAMTTAKTREQVQAREPAPAAGEPARKAGPKPEDPSALSAKRLDPPDPADAKSPIRRDPAASDKSPKEQGGREKTNGQGLTPKEQEIVRELEKRDREVRAHEQAHMAAGTGNIVQGADYSYQRGPDGQRYAVGGDVQIDVSPVPGDPEATIEKAEEIYKAALAPARPSAQDRQVAAQAMQMKAEARAEQLREQTTGDSSESVDLFA